MNEAITDAVILMAGSGSRLRRCGEVRFKPLVQLSGRPLISYLLETLGNHGFKTIHAVIGFERDSLRRELEPLFAATDFDVRWIDNPRWQLKNGVSLLAAAPYLDRPFFLTMADHIFDEKIVDLLMRSRRSDSLNLAIDRKLDSIFDMNDAMKVQTHGEEIIAIGKELHVYDAIDTGAFVCPPRFFSYLEKAQVDGDCSLADGVQAMAVDGLAHGIDIGDAWWQDIDTPEMRARAEQHLHARRHAPVASV